MIVYNESWFGLPLLSRARGSAVIKALSPTALSTAVMLGIYFANGWDIDSYVSVEHPYAIGVIMAAFTFLLTFRANFAYNRVRKKNKMILMYAYKTTFYHYLFIYQVLGSLWRCSFNA